MDNQFTVTPIGYVCQNDGNFCLKLDLKYAAALSGLEGFSHIKVLWWAHGFETPEYRQVVTIDKPYTKGPKKVGVFSTRAPIRPNLIMVSTAGVKTIDDKNGQIYLYHIDAVDGTPILDIKPYQPSEDRIRDCEVPSWCQHWPQWYEDSASFDWQKEFTFPD